jgi:hypothetical protein
VEWLDFSKYDNICPPPEGGSPSDGPKG